MIYTLVYISFAAGGLREKELSEILEASRRNNQKRGITGLLLYAEGNIIQVLEGNQEEVEALYEKIGLDERHERITRLFAGHSETRLFSEWSMAYKRMSLSTIKEILPRMDEMLAGDISPKEAKIKKRIDLLISSYLKTVNV
ncbi:MAG: BLUF domain-containing protein [Rhodothermaceae bacterium]|nr:BLUF domain-containing protein [Rhodothermaceae bacterium]